MLGSLRTCSRRKLDSRTLFFFPDFPLLAMRSAMSFCHGVCKTMSRDLSGLQRLYYLPDCTSKETRLLHTFLRSGRDRLWDAPMLPFCSDSPSTCLFLYSAVFKLPITLAIVVYNWGSFVCFCLSSQKSVTTELFLSSMFYQIFCSVDTQQIILEGMSKQEVLWY